MTATWPLAVLPKPPQYWGDAYGALTLTWISGVVHYQDAIASHRPFQHDLDALPVESFGVPTLHHAPRTFRKFILVSLTVFIVTGLSALLLVK